MVADSEGGQGIAVLPIRCRNGSAALFGLGFAGDRVPAAQYECFPCPRLIV